VACTSVEASGSSIEQEEQAIAPKQQSIVTTLQSIEEKCTSIETASSLRGRDCTFGAPTFSFVGTKVSSIDTK
jgi:hypothetical protein